VPKTYLDDQGNPIPAPKVYLDADGEPTRSVFQRMSTPPPSTSFLVGALPQSTAAGDPQVDGAGRGVMSDEQWAALPPGEKARNVLKWGGNVVASLTGMGAAGQDAVENPKTTLATAAVPALARGAASIPTRAKAGVKFQQVMGAVGDKPVDIARAGDSALRISQLAERGGSMPKAVRDLLRRATDPGKGDISYKELRDFYSNISRLSADESKRLTPVVRKELNTLRAAMDEALAKTAASGGQEEVYRAAMREYALASRIREFAEKATKYGAGIAGAGAAYNMLKN